MPQSIDQSSIIGEDGDKQEQEQEQKQEQELVVYAKKTETENEKESVKKESVKKETEKESTNNSQRIQLNVGGIRYETTLSTLTKYENSVLSKMFEGKISVKADSDGSYFIDRNGKHFEHILDYLRSGQMNIDYIKRNCLLNHLLIEADFYQLIRLTSILKIQSTKIVNYQKYYNNGIHLRALNTKIICFYSADSNINSDSANKCNNSSASAWGDKAATECNKWLKNCGNAVEIFNVWSEITFEKYHSIYVVYTDEK